MSPARAVLADVLDRVRPITGGEVANYIPQLALADPDAFGIAAVSTSGAV